MDTPTPDMIRSARLAAGHSQTGAGEAVGVSLRTWQNWESLPAGGNARAMPVAAWELYLLRTGQHPTHRLVARGETT